MKTKVGKWLKYLAAGAFLLALIINVKVTLDDPFVLMSDAALAVTTTTTTTTTTNAKYTVWHFPVLISGGYRQENKVHHVHSPGHQNIITIRANNSHKHI